MMTEINASSFSVALAVEGGRAPLLYHRVEPGNRRVLPAAGADSDVRTGASPFEHREALLFPGFSTRIAEDARQHGLASHREARVRCQDVDALNGIRKSTPYHR
jgi:hypothetical protein